MAEFLTTEGISHNLKKIILESKGKLALISPYLQLSTDSFELLKSASHRNIRIRLIFGKQRLNTNDRNYLKKIENLEVKFLRDLHSKCYLNESSMVITSMNLIEYSQKNNREMGILITRKADNEIFENALIEIASIIRDSKKVDLVKESVEGNDLYPRQTGSFARQFNFGKGLYKNLMEGHCIRCCSVITYNPEKPYCEFCYQTWARYRVREYHENVCHGCGNQNHSTINRPECFSCFSH